MQQVQHEQQQRQQMQQVQLQMMPNPMFAYSGMMMPNMGMSSNMGMSRNMGMPGMFPFAQFQFPAANGVNTSVVYSNMNPNMNPVKSNMNLMNKNVNLMNAMNLVWISRTAIWRPWKLH